VLPSQMDLQSEKKRSYLTHNSNVDST
jgi:hypothetical protein